MRPEGMSATDAANTLAEIRRNIIDRETAAGGVMSGERVTEAVRKEWAELCGVEFVPQWKLNRQAEPVAPGAVAPTPVVKETVAPAPVENNVAENESPDERDST